MAGFGFGAGFGNQVSRFNQLASAQPLNPSLRPSAAWDGAPSSGFSSTPVDPNRTTAKPICRLLTPPRQTVTFANLIGVFAAANDGGSLVANLGISHVDFHCEGSVVRVETPSFRTFMRPDGSSYDLLGWWATLSRPSTKEGIANVYIEAVPLDGSMQSRVSGPFSFVMSKIEYDYDITVAKSGGSDFLTMQEAFSHLRRQNAKHPRIRVVEAGDYDLQGGGGHTPLGWCKIEATHPVKFRQPAPELVGDFTRFRPNMDRLHFKGPNIIIDFAETLEFYTEQIDGQHWLDGVDILQSRGRTDLWRLGPRNLVPSLFRNGAWFTDCKVTDVNDAFDKAPLVRGCRVSKTWADLAQDARCFVSNEITDHTSSFYYTNVDAMSIAYSGTGSPTISIRNAPRSLVLRVDGADIGSIAFDSSEQGFRNDTNYRVANAVDWVNLQKDWTATLIDDTRLGASLSPPGTTNGSAEEDIAVPAVLPTHFDIHSDIYQLPILPELRENVVFCFNTFNQIDAQNIFIQPEPGVRDSIFAVNAFYNNLGTGDEGLSSSLAGMISHGLFVHNTLATQRLRLPFEDLGGDAYSLISNNVVRRLSVRENQPIPPLVTVANNHAQDDIGLPSGAVATSIGGDATTLFVDAVNGGFAPSGILLQNGVAPLLERDLKTAAFPMPAAKGAIAAPAGTNSGIGLPSWSVLPTISGLLQVGEILTGNPGEIANGALSASQWLRDGLAITAATNISYTLIAADEGATITYSVEATGPSGEAFASSAAVGPIVEASPPSLEPSLVDSVKASGSAGTVTASGLSANGNDQYVFVMVGAGTSDAVNDISCSISGSGGTTAMTRVFFQGTNAEDPQNALEAFAGFVIEGGNFPGTGPYNLDATATGSNPPDKIGIVAGSVRNAPNAPVIVSTRSQTVSATPGEPNTLVLAGLGSSTGTSGATMSGANQVENLDYGDGLQLGWTSEGVQTFTVINDVPGRSVSAAILFSQ